MCDRTAWVRQWLLITVLRYSWRLRQPSPIVPVFSYLNVHRSLPVTAKFRRYWSSHSEDRRDWSWFPCTILWQIWSGKHNASRGLWCRPCLHTFLVFWQLRHLPTPAPQDTCSSSTAVSIERVLCEAKSWQIGRDKKEGPWSDTGPYIRNLLPPEASQVTRVNRMKANWRNLSP